jgi:hypothetical protein
MDLGGMRRLGTAGRAILVIASLAAALRPAVAAPIVRTFAGESMNIDTAGVVVTASCSGAGRTPAGIPSGRKKVWKWPCSPGRRSASG